MKNKIKATLTAAALIGAALIAGGIDNDYATRQSQERPTCHQITTPDGTSICR